MDDSRNASSLQYVQQYFNSRINDASTANPFNVIANAILSAKNAQTISPTLIDDFYSTLLTFLRSNSSDDNWGNMSIGNNSPTSNDVILSASLIFAILTGPLGFSIEGGVTDTHFYYQDMRVNRYTTAVLPASWDRVVLSNVGGSSGIIMNTN